MKKIFLSFMISTSMILGVLSVNAVSIDYEDFDVDSISETVNEDASISMREVKIEEMIQNEYITPFEAANSEIMIYSDNVWNYSYTGNVQTFTAPNDGYYTLECYGGGTNYSLGGYAKGTVFLKKDEKMYIYVGGQSSLFNGGNRASNITMDCSNLATGTPSSGATDIRVIPATNGSWYISNHSSWNTDKSLLSRLVTAGGGASTGLNVSCSFSLDPIYYYYPYNYPLSNNILGLGTAGTGQQLAHVPGEDGGHRALIRSSGGGGWYGGATSGNVAYAGTSNVLGSFQLESRTYTVTDGTVKNAQNQGNGKAIITLSSSNYTVNYYKMDLNGNYVLDESVTNTESVGVEVTPEVKTYEGFKSPEPITKTVEVDGSTEISYYYERNKYEVTYIDKTPDGKEIGKTTKLVYYDADVRGAELGDDKADNKYYLQYKYVSDTSAKVTAEGAVVYRIFEFCETEATSNLKWNDENNKDGFRPNKYKLILKQNGILIDEVELSSDETNYTFPNLPKYDSVGKLYQYTFSVDASDRYQISFDDNGNLIIEDYQPASFSVVIPKNIVLDGNTGKADYSVSVKGKFYYNDTLTVKPEGSFIMTDRSNISSMHASVTQIKTGFTKEDGVSNSCVTSGSIQVNRTNFAGLWNGTFHFDIKFVMKN